MNISVKTKVLLAGFCSQLLCIGIARFAYTPLLPLMQEQMGLSDTAGGWLATVNYIGYMLGAVIASVVVDFERKDRLYRLALFVAVLSTGAMALTDNIYIWAGLRFIAGLSSAGAMLLASGLILNWLMRHHFRGELGLHFAGVGVGISLAAAAVQAMLMFELHWDVQWTVFAALGVVLLIPAWRWLPKPGHTLNAQTGNTLTDHPPSRPFFILMLAAYFCAGYGYVINATFIVAIIERQPALAGNGAVVFFVIGLCAAAAVLLWDRVARKIGTLHALMFAYGLQFFGIVLPVLSTTL
ncbi:MAG: YbfB/YjiJ family MFS transporter, partial [Magnetovibrio sp.]|nr:YbfB/YjiJ family MFS transporter [Magnetovibrio sp.]